MLVAADAAVAVIVVSRCVMSTADVAVFAAAVAVLAVVGSCRWLGRLAVPSLPCFSLVCLDVALVSLVLLLPLLLLLLLQYVVCLLFLLSACCCWLLLV